MMVYLHAFFSNKSWNLLPSFSETDTLEQLVSGGGRDHVLDLGFLPRHDAQRSPAPLEEKLGGFNGLEWVVDVSAIIVVVIWGWNFP